MLCWQPPLSLTPSTLAQNRTVPPLRHEWAWALKRDFPHLSFSLNGGVQNALEAAAAINLDVAGLGPGAIEGVMIGRAGVCYVCVRAHAHACVFAGVAGVRGALLCGACLVVRAREQASAHCRPVH